MERLGVKEGRVVILVVAQWKLLHHFTLRGWDRDCSILQATTVSIDCSP